ncbi:hypothetical protein [Leptospira jelokensis]|uniref:hypothetical protein n=1 Tax=Leptospira jelokensis TaxID=2484931 RepID=UPI001090E982|nr:hypothetical protein [Leptospira jelokensis]TGM06277.1 hypothetical protein EHQ79_01725 [Leptospira jelokensis]
MLIPLSLVSILQIEKSEEQNRLNECTGRIPGKICITIVEHHPVNIKQIELFQGGNLISILDATGVPITGAMCSIYYNLQWNASAPYRSTKIYLKNTDGEICGIGWEEKDVKTIDQLLDASNTDTQLNTVTEINSNGLTLKFYR